MMLYIYTTFVQDWVAVSWPNILEDTITLWEIIPHLYDIIKKLYYNIVQEVRKFTYKSAVVIIMIVKQIAMMKLFQLQSKSQEQVFASQIARHLAITINELKLRYTTSLLSLI